MTVDEQRFEEHIAAWLVEHGGYREAKVGNLFGDFDTARGLDTAELFAFIGQTQNDAWERLVKLRGSDAAKARLQFADRLAKEIDARGTVDVLRHGVIDLGVSFRLAYFRPAHGLTPELTGRYAANRLTVARQLPYEAGSNRTDVPPVLRTLERLGRWVPTGGPHTWVTDPRTTTTSSAAR